MFSTNRNVSLINLKIGNLYKHEKLELGVNLNQAFHAPSMELALV